MAYDPLGGGVALGDAPYRGQVKRAIFDFRFPISDC